MFAKKASFLKLGAPAEYFAADTYGTANTDIGTGDYIQLTYNPAGNNFVMSKHDGFYLHCRVGTVTNDVISWGADATLLSSSQNIALQACYVGNGKIVYQLNESGTAKAVVVTVTGTSCSFGTPVTYATSSATRQGECSYNAAQDKVLFVYDNSASRGCARVGTVSGTTISFGTEVIWHNDTDSTRYTYRCAYDANSGNNVVVFCDGSDVYGKGSVVSISGTVPTFNTWVTWKAAFTGQDQMTIIPYTSGKMLLTYYDYSNNQSSGSMILTVSGTTFSYTATTYYFQTASQADGMATAHYALDGRVVVFYFDAGGWAYIRRATATVSGTVISYSAFVPVVDGTMSNVQGLDMIYHPGVNRLILAYRDPLNSSILTVKTLALATI